MAINYKSMKRAEAGKKGGGEAKYYAIATHRSLVDFEEIAHDISSRCTVRPADVSAVLISLSELIPEYIMNGKSVKLNNIGIISATLQSVGTNLPEEITQSVIKGLKLHFLPDKKIKKQLRLCNFKKISE